MSNVPVFDWKSTVSVNGPIITDFDFPILAHEKPFDAKELFAAFCENFDETLSTCRGNYLGVTNEFGVVMKRSEVL